MDWSMQKLRVYYIQSVEYGITVGFHPGILLGIWACYAIQSHLYFAIRDIFILEMLYKCLWGLVIFTCGNADLFVCRWINALTS